MKRIFILGPGRAGTTFLVKLFTRLNFNTGFTPYQEEGYSDKTRAGCEVVMTWNPYASDEDLRKDFDTMAFEVIKGPAFSFTLEAIMKRRILDIKHVFIPVRSLNTIAKSRIDAGLHWENIPKSFNAQRDYSALALGFSIDLCITYNLSFTLMKFPDFVKDIGYCYKMLSEGVKLNRQKFSKVFEQTVDLKNIKFNDQKGQ